MRLSQDDTIAAISTPAASSMAAIVRLSGNEALPIAQSLISGSQEALPTPSKNKRTGHGCKPLTWSVSFCHLSISMAGYSVRVPAYVMFFAAPKSYTRQDMVEFIVPGNEPIATAVLKQCLQSGARAAYAGEFTLRAFLSGRIDLAQAEAVEQIIHAANQQERIAALQRLQDDIPTSIRTWRDQLIAIAAQIEATLDFHEEELDHNLTKSFLTELNTLSQNCHHITSKTKHQKSQEQGIPVVLAGLTNAGKSSLLNSLLGEDAAIVSSENSTTRDRLSYSLQLGRFLFRLEDSPGADNSLMQSNQGTVFTEGIHKGAYRGGTFVCLVIDRSRLSSDVLQLKSFIQNLPLCRILPILNKSEIASGDLNEINDCLKSIFIDRQDLTVVTPLEISCKTGWGIKELKERLIAEAIGNESLTDHGILTLREAEELRQASDHCQEASTLLEEGMDLELIAEELRHAHEAFSRAIGDCYAENVLDAIFSRFCIGK